MDADRAHERRRMIEAAVAAIVLVGALGAAYLTGEPAAGPEVVHLSGRTMSTTYSVKVVEDDFDDGARDALQTLIDTEIELVDELMSRYREGSEIDRLNRSRSTEAVPVSPELLHVLLRAREVSEQSDGAFDVTVGPLIELWGFDDKRARDRVPGPAEIDEALRRIGFRSLEIDRGARTVRKQNPVLDIDLSAIAKGYAVDRIALALDGRGHKDYLVEVGGEVRCAGSSHRGTPWRVAVERPVEGKREVFRIVELSDRALATSGDYRNFYEVDGRRYSHTVDPRSGRPVFHRLASVTVIHDECVAADALATALTVMGPEEGLAFAEERGLHAFFIERREEGSLRSFASAPFERDYPTEERGR
jgi:thiamine biosynthesis lipoprotein